MAACDCQHVREAVVLMDVAPRRPADNRPMTFTFEPTAWCCATIWPWQLNPHQRLEVRSLISLSVQRGSAGRLQFQLLPFRISLWPSQNKKTSLFLLVWFYRLWLFFVWQLCEHVVEQSKAALKLVMMWKSQLCSSSVVMKILPFRLNLRDLCV